MSTQSTVIFCLVVFFLGCQQQKNAPAPDPLFAAEEASLQTVPLGCQPLSTPFTLTGKFNRQGVCAAGDSTRTTDSQFISSAGQVDNGGNLKQFYIYIDQNKTSAPASFAITSPQVDKQTNFANYIQQKSLLNVDLPIQWLPPYRGDSPIYQVKFELPVTVKTASGEQQGQITYTSMNKNQPATSYLRLVRIRPLVNGYALTYQFRIRLFSGTYPDKLWLDITDGEFTGFAPLTFK